MHSIKKQLPKETLQFFLWVQQNLSYTSAERYWLRSIFPGLFDIVSLAKIKTRVWNGQGASSNLIEAHVKSTAEIVERECMLRHNIFTSNGCAVHSSLKKAKQSARFELIERDAFFCHFLTATPMDPLAPEGLKIHGATWKQFEKRLFNKGLKIRFFRMRAAVSDVYAMTAVLTVHEKAPALARKTLRTIGKFGMRMGHGCDFDLSQAATQSAIECLRSVAHIIDSGLKVMPLSEKEFMAIKRSKKKYTVNDHHRLLLDRQYAKKIEKILLSGPKAGFETGKPVLKISQIKAVQYSTSFEDIGRIPLYFVRADAKKLQQLYFGANKKHYFNLKRLKLFMGPHHKVKLNLMPHPFA